MFGFRGGERPDVVARKKEYRLAAQERWPFLTHFDLSTIKNKAQLSSMVKDRSGVSAAQATADVEVWAAGKQF